MRYRGLAMNTLGLLVSCALANLFIVRHELQSEGLNMQITRIGVIGAMPQEIALLRQEMTDVQERNLGSGKGARIYSTGKLYGKHTTLVFSRWGKVASASTVTSLIDTAKVDLILFTGVAGAISPDLEIGDVVIGDELVQHDLDARPLYARYEVPQLGIERFPIRPEYIKLARISAEGYLRDGLATDVPAEVRAEFGIIRPRVRIGLIVTGDQFISDPTGRDRLGRELPNALCVEMEGAAVAQVCYERDIPLVVARTISDKADHHVDFMKFVNKIASHFTCGIVKEFVAGIE